MAFFFVIIINTFQFIGILLSFCLQFPTICYFSVCVNKICFQIKLQFVCTKYPEYFIYTHMTNYVQRKNQSIEKKTILN